MFTQTRALAAAVLGVVQSLTLLGQARTLKRIGSAREVSLPFLYLAVLSSTAWLLYGALHGDAALVAVNSVGLTGAATTLITAVRLRVADGADSPAAGRAPHTMATAHPLAARPRPAWLSRAGCAEPRRPTGLEAGTSLVEDQPALALAALPA